MGNLCKCFDKCRKGIRQDYGPQSFISIPTSSNDNKIEIDFHHMKVLTAQTLLKETLDLYSNPNYNSYITEIHLIVGKGIHSEGGEGGRKIYPMVFEEIKTNYKMYSAEDHPTNGGVIVAKRINLGTQQMNERLI